MVADALGVELDEVRCDAEYAQTTEDLDLGSWTIPAGCVAGIVRELEGIVGDKVVIELNVRWRKGQTLEPDWKIEQDGWVIQIEGRPTVTLNVGFLPPPDFEAETIEDFMVLGHIMTARRRSTPSPQSWPPRRASPPTPTCRWSSPAAPCRRAEPQMYMPPLTPMTWPVM